MDIYTCDKIFKNSKHESYYVVFMNLISESLWSFANIQAAMWFIALVATENRRKCIKTFQDISQSLPSGCFKSSDLEGIANTYALGLWNAIFIACEDKFMEYFTEAWNLGLAKILKQD